MKMRLHDTISRNNFNGETFIFSARQDDPGKASFKVQLDPGGSGGGSALVHVHPTADETFSGPTAPTGLSYFRNPDPGSAAMVFGQRRPAPAANRIGSAPVSGSPLPVRTAATAAKGGFRHPCQCRPLARIT